MKIKIRNLQGKEFELEVEPSDSIASLREKVVSFFQYPPEKTARLIFSGTVLADENTIESSKVVEGASIVCVPTKAPAKPKVEEPKPEPKPEPKVEEPKPEEPKPEPKPEEPKPEEPKPEEHPKDPIVQPVPVPGPDAPKPAEEVKVSEEAIEQLTAMGYERESAVQALKIARGNVQVAVNILCDPDMLSGAPSHGHGYGPSQGGATLTAEDQALIQEVISHQDMIQGFISIAQNPSVANVVLPILEKSHPEIMRKLVQKRELLMLLIQTLPSLLQGGGAEMGEEDDSPSGSPATSSSGSGGAPAIELTKEDQEAIDNLVAMGFSRQEALQAYIACDKNVQLAANFLFDN